MITFSKIIFLIAISIATLACSDSGTNDPVTPPSADFKYPYAINSFWYYGSRNFVTNLRPDSVRIYFSTDTTLGLGGATFEKDTVINNDTLRRLRNGHSSAGHSHTTLEYYKQTDTGLVRVAYFTNGANFGPFSPAGDQFTFTHNNKTYNSINELVNCYRYDTYYDSGDTNKIIFDDPPLRVLRYPIEKNIQWNFITNGTTRITKKYLDFENVTVPAGTFSCIKIKRDWYYNSPDPDPNTFSYDYFSKEGMIKRDFLIKNVLISNSKGTPIGHLDVREDDFLNLFVLP